MVQSVKTPPQSYLDRCFGYCPETGILTWKKRPRGHFLNEASCNSWNARFAGKTAFYVRPDGYVSGGLKYNGTIGQFRAHRIIWKLVTGSEAENVDHIDGDRSNNRWANLRSVNHQVNACNTHRVAKTSTNVMGVTRNRKRFSARLMRAGVLQYLGSFETVTEAAAAYAAAVANDANAKVHKCSA